jgi:hypothetical protein
MAMGSLTLACALLAANADLPEITYLPQATFEIPIRFSPDRRATIKELQLYVSHDQGNTWNRELFATPDQRSFRYTTTNDGTYWFNVAIIDLKGNQEPVDIMAAPPGQRVVVDTRKPEIRILRAERTGDEVRVQWDIREENPDLNSFRMEVRSADQSTMWTPVNVRPALQGEVTFRLPVQGPVQVRILMGDLAKNLGQGEKEIGATGGPAVVPAPEPVTTNSNVIPAPPAPGEPTPLQPPPGTSVGEYRPVQAVDVSRPQPYRNNDDNSVTRQQPIPTIPQSIPVPGPSQIAASAQPIQQLSGTERPSTVVNQYTPPATRAGLPPVELVNKPQARIEFQIGKYGPSGLGSVDVYVTSDDGASWTPSTTDHSVTLPTAAEMHSGVPVTGAVMVNLKDEGVVHGYYIVVKSAAGLGKAAPRAGTPPQIRIELDMTPPTVELYKPKADPNRRDTLLLTWQAKDKNPAANPVTLEWAERRDGQWNVIGTPDMSDSGQFNWQVPVNVPPSVYLRLSVKDAAGNRAVAQTQEPEVVDLSVPETVGFRVSK